MKVLFIFIILIIGIGVFAAITKERRAVTQYFDAPNGKKYKAQYSMRIERYKWWIGSVPKLKNNFQQGNSAWGRAYLPYGLLSRFWLEVIKFKRIQP